MSSLQNEINRLSAAEKFELLDRLWDSLEAKDAAPTSEQKVELESRASGYERDPSDAIPWEQVKAGLFKRQ